MVGRIPRAPVFAPVRTRTLPVQAHGTASTAVLVDQWRYPDTGTVVGRRVVAGHRHFRGYRRVELGRTTTAAATADHHLVVHVGQHRLVVHEVERRGGHRGRRGSVVD